MHAELNRRGHRIARCTVHRLMRADGLRGISRAKGPRTTIPGAGPDTRPDLLDRNFKAPAPNRVWVADITYCRTFGGWVYAAFVIDVYSRRVVGCRCRRVCAPTWRWTPSRWGSGPATAPRHAPSHVRRAYDLHEIEARALARLKYHHTGHRYWANTEEIVDHLGVNRSRARQLLAEDRLPYVTAPTAGATSGVTNSR